MVNKEELKNIAWMPLDFPDYSIEKMKEEIEAIPDEDWYFCTFRDCFLLCIYGSADVMDKSNMDWLPYAKDCHEIQRFCDEFIFPKTNKIPRIILIRTFNGDTMRHHTDCSMREIDDVNLKLRLVLKGGESKLYYPKQSGGDVEIDSDVPFYMMSGTCLHGMRNTGEEKLTLCWGDPWLGDDFENEEFSEFISTMAEKHKDKIIYRDDLGDRDYHISGIKDTAKERIMSWREYHK